MPETIEAPRPQRFRKKPVEIEAMPWDGTAAGATPIIDWILANVGTARYHGPDEGDPDCPNRSTHGAPFRYCSLCSFVEADHRIAIDTLEGTMKASPGDWIIRGIEGEFYPCRPDIFAGTYEVIP